MENTFKEYQKVLEDFHKDAELNETSVPPASPPPQPSPSPSPSPKSEQQPVDDTSDLPNQNPMVTRIAGKVRDVLIAKVKKLEDEHSLFIVLRITMECIEIEDIAGMNKKELAESVVRKLIKESEMSDEKKNICLNLIEAGTLGDTIDLVVSATKGELALNKKTKKKLLACLGSCISNINK